MAAASLSMTTIDQFYASRHCIVCDGLTPAKQPICDLCLQAPQLTTAVLKARRFLAVKLFKAERLDHIVR